MTRSPLVTALFAVQMTLASIASASQGGRDAAATPKVGTAVIAGTVVSAEDPTRPLRRTLLTLTGAEISRSLLAMSDDAGRFSFAALPAGRYTMTARKTGYVRDVFGARPAGVGAGVPIVVADAARVSIRMTLIRSASISGTVRMPPGAPLSAIRLQLLRPGFADGRPQLVPARGGAYGLDVDGQFRFPGLPPGQYYVTVYAIGGVERRLAVEGGEGRTVGFAPVLYPGTSDAAQAQPIVLRAGEERAGADVQFDYVPTSRLRGDVLDADGQPVPFAQVTITDASPVSRGGVAPVRVRPDGTFVVSGLAPGRYTIVARAAVPGTESARPGPYSQGPATPLWARAEVDVQSGAELSGLRLLLRPGRVIEGRADLAGAQGAPLNPTGVLAILAPADAATTVIGVAPAEITPNGRFRIPGVAPGKYRLQIVLPQVQRDAWTVQSIVAGDRDVLDQPLEVTAESDVNVQVVMTDRPSALSGSLVDATSASASTPQVVVFSTDRRHWLPQSRRVVLAIVGTDGTYRVLGLPAGEYDVATTRDADPERVHEPSLLEELAKTAVRVVIRDGQPTQQDLKGG